MSDQTVPAKNQRLNAEVTTIERSPCLKYGLNALRLQMWPAFLNHASDCRWNLLAENFPGYQMLLVADKRPVAVGHTIPLAWNQSADGLPDSIDDTLLSAIGGHEAGNPADTLAVLGVFVSADCQGNGLSALMLKALKQLANEQGLASMIVTVRPAFKSRYPLVSMNEYITWKRADGSPFDPAIRCQWKAGATVMKTATRAMTVIGTVADWENWTEMRFVESGEYIVDGALKPVLIDLASDLGWYEDPFLWMHHFIERDASSDASFIFLPRPPDAERLTAATERPRSRSTGAEHQERRKHERRVYQNDRQLPVRGGAVPDPRQVAGDRQLPLLEMPAISRPLRRIHQR